MISFGLGPRVALMISFGLGPRVALMISFGLGSRVALMISFGLGPFWARGAQASTPPRRHNKQLHFKQVRAS